MKSVVVDAAAGVIGIVLSLVLLQAATLPVWPAPSAQPYEPSLDHVPPFAVLLADGTFREYPSVRAKGDEASIADALLDASVERRDSDTWALTLRPKRAAITRVWFPWNLAIGPLGNDADDDLLYYPALNGVLLKASRLSASTYTGLEYPGPTFSPLMVVADSQRARVIAATNWPPRRVAPLYRKDSLALRYDTVIAPRSSETYRAVIADVPGDAAAGSPPWQLASDRYKAWLAPHVRAAGLSPAAYPDWLEDAEGWLNVQLQNVYDTRKYDLTGLWKKWKDPFPWIQFWGQMSDYTGRPSTGRSPTPRAGCCLPLHDLHQRYEATIPAFVKRARSEGRVGFYSRPHPYPTSDDPQELASPLHFLREWTRANTERYGANAAYVDVIGHRYFGPPLGVAKFIRDEMPAGTVIEYAVDVYPAAVLISGSLQGGTWDGGPTRTIDGSSSAVDRTTFPRFGRYVLDDRIMFLGESNGDHVFWGAEQQHWTERQAFLLGAKLDVIHPAQRGAPDRLNDALQAIVDARKHSGWWNRRPVYADTQGISDVTPGVEVRHFIGNGGEHLFAIDNWNGVSPAGFRFASRYIPVPAHRLAVLVDPEQS